MSAGVFEQFAGTVDKPVTFVGSQQERFWRREEPVVQELPDGEKRLLKGGMLSHQREWWDLPTFVKVLIGGYGSGKTNVNAKAAISLALENAPAPIACVSPTFPLARQTTIPTLEAYLAGKQTLYGRQFWWKRNKSTNEFRLRFRGRSGHIIVYSGDDPISLRGPNLGAALIDEPFIQEQAVFDQMVARVRHPEAVHRMIGLTGCVTRDSWVCTRQGWIRIGDLDPGTHVKQYTPLGLSVLGIHNQFHEATQFYNNGQDETVKLQLTGGYGLEGTPDHPVLVMGEKGKPVYRRMGSRRWKYAELNQLTVTDSVAVSRGMEAWGNVDPCTGFTPRIKDRFPDIAQMSEDLAYFLGLWIAEGSFEEGRICITCKERVDYLMDKGVLGLKFLRSREDQCRVNSVDLAGLFKHIGMPLVKAPEKCVPQWVFSGRREWALAFLAGMFDGDGHACQDGSGLGYSTTSEALAKDLQILLLNLGIITTRGKAFNAPTERVNVWSVSNHVRIAKSDAHKFAKWVCPRIERKRKVLRQYRLKTRDSDCIPNQAVLMLRAWAQRQCLRWRKGTSKLEPNKLIECAKKGSGSVSYSNLRDFVARWRANELCVPEEIHTIEDNLEDNYYWADVRKVSKGFAPTVDFVIPDTNSFTPNGIQSKQTPEQLNWGYDLVRGELKTQYEEAGSSVGYVQASTRGNYVLDSNYVKRLEGSLTGKAAEAYIEGALVQLTKGLVYYGFQGATGVNVRQIPVPLGAEWGCGMDFNVNPFACVVFWRAGSHMHFVKEYEFENADTQYACDVLKEHWVDLGDNRLVSMNHTLRVIYPDSTGDSRHTNAPGGKTDFTYIRRAGFTIDAPHNPSPRDRENAVNGKFNPKVGESTLTVDPKCRKLIKYLSTYAHELKHKQRAMSHLLDAFGYPIYRLFPINPESMKFYNILGI